MSTSIPCALGKLVPNTPDYDRIKREGWTDHGILVVNANDPRLNIMEQAAIAGIGRKLYGQRANNGNR